jgi:hypothetical protein
VIRLIRDKKINRKIASQKWFVTETGKAMPQTGIGKTKRTLQREPGFDCSTPAAHRPRHDKKSIEEKRETIEQKEEKKRAGGRNHLRVT